MNKHEFSPAGLQALLAELYQLSDSELALEVAAILANFRSWLISRFNFEPSQIAYLEAIDNLFIVAAATATAQFIAARQAISLVKEEPVPTQKRKEEGEGKFIWIKKESNYRYAADTPYQTEDTLVFTIAYQN